jgi:hypothetical protein
MAGGEVAKGRAVDQGGNHLRGLCCLDEGWVVVANRNGSNLRVAVLTVRSLKYFVSLINSLNIHIKVLVAVNIDNALHISQPLHFIQVWDINNILVARALIIIGNKVESSAIKERAQLLGLGLGLRSRDFGSHLYFTNRRHCCNKELDVMIFRFVKLELILL